MSFRHGDNAKTAHILRAQPVDRLAIEDNLPRSAGNAPAIDSTKLTFAGAVGAEKRRDLARRNFEIDAVDDLLPPRATVSRKPTGPRSCGLFDEGAEIRGADLGILEHLRGGAVTRS